ncbi:NB-ARC domain-containing protein [Roseiflexus sp. RS-1]|uniref:NB-ARC domain-containing protein n=1 Tax=Roseiflexus sp. (strain RS-1) TaxID=357808 RepID=UPI0000D81934|nr:NB-ARC domain-containing protein [Roseiflexus sp. RS-1]ABQ92370.1 NB-ARC domain protein [Roseiflexus sp. RS-1]
MLLEPLFAAIAEAVFVYLLQESTLTERIRATLGLDPTRRAFQTALARAYTVFARHYPEWTTTLFDQPFLTSPTVVPLLAELLTRRGQPDPAHLARLFAAHLGHPDPDRWERLGDATRAAADFLTWLEGELARQDALQPLFDSRALERIAEHTGAIRRALEALAHNRQTAADLDLLRQALRDGQVALATGERAVALGSSADSVVIVTGDGNIVQVLNVQQRTDLERLLTTRRYNLPSLPEHYVLREADLERLRQALLNNGAVALGIVGVKGMGGIGKSVLAAALARDLAVQAAFPDGIVWLPIGREPNLPARQEELYLFLTGQRENFRDAIQGRSFLSVALEGKTCLVILDDVWDSSHAEAFPVVTGSATRYLITTRNAEVLQTLNAPPVSLDVLSPDQALSLLADWTGQPVANLPSIACEVARECGYLPLALAMVGAFVRQNPESWERALHRLQTADLAKLRRLFPGYEHPTLLAALEVSVEAMAATDRARYLDLAVFPEEAAIPLPVLHAFWQPLGLDEDDVADLAETFVNRSLARRDEDGRLRLHDLQHDYLRACAGANLPVLHRRFLLACARSFLGASGETLEGLPWHRLPSQPNYLWDRLVYHHLQAGAWDAIYALLTDFDFLEARCRATTVFELEADYRLALNAWPQEDTARREVLSAFEERLRLEASRIAQAPEWFFPALYNHLRWLDAPDGGPLHRLCETAAFHRTNYLRSRLDPRPEPPLWLRSLEGHTHWVLAVAVSPDGRTIVSGSHDRTVKVWEAESGRLLRSLEGHTGSVRAVAVSPDGRTIVSGSHDRTVKVWEAESGRLLRSLEGHTGSVRAVAVSPDGRTIVSGSHDRTVKVWEAESGRLLRSLEGHTGSVRAVAVSPDGRTIVSGSHDRTVKVWDAASGRLLRSLKGHTGSVLAVAVSPDGRTIVSGSHDRTVKVWEAESGRLLRSLEGHTGSVRAVAVSPDGRTIVSGSWDNTVKVWEAESGRPLRSLEGHTGSVRAVAVSPDGRTIVSGSDDRTVKVWEAESGRLLRSLEGHTDWVLAVAVSPDGRTIVSGSRDRTVKVWEAESGRLLRSLEGHTGSVLAVAVSPDGRTIVSGSHDRTVKVWEAESGRLLRSLEGHTDWVRAVAVSPDGRTIVSGSWDNTVKVWEAESGRLLRSLEGHTGSVRAVAVSPDGRTIVSGSHDRTVKVWDAASGRLLRSLEGHTDWVLAVAVSPDGRTIVSGSHDRTVKVWEAESGRLLRSLEGHTGGVNAVAVSPDGRTIVSGSDDRTVKVWEAESGRLLRSLEGHTGSVLAVAVSPDGRTIVSGSDDRTVKVWEAESGRLLRSLEGHTGSVLAVAVSPDGRTIVSGSDDRTVKVWEAESGRLLRSLEGHTDWVRAVAVSPDGRTIVSGSWDNTVKVWEAESGRLLRSLKGHTGSVRAVAVSPDGRTIVSGSWDNTVKVWEAESGRLLRSLEGHTGGVNAVAVSPDGRTIVSGSWDHTIRAWNLESGESCVLFWNDAAIRSLALSGDGQLLVCGDVSGRVWLFDVVG